MAQLVEQRENAGLFTPCRADDDDWRALVPEGEAVARVSPQRVDEYRDSDASDGLTPVIECASW